MKYLFLILSLITIVSCKTTPSSYSSKQSEPYTPAPVGVQPVSNAALVNGSLYLQGAMSQTPLVNVEVRLLNQRGIPLAITTTSVGGQFTLQKALDEGEYKLVVNNKKYKGSLPIQFVNKNIENLKFFVEEVRKP